MQERNAVFQLNKFLYLQKNNISTITINNKNKKKLNKNKRNNNNNIKLNVLIST
jgi:hypothetical protein